MAFDSTTIRPAIGNLPEINELEDRVAALEESLTPSMQAALDAKPDSATIDNITVLTQGEYDAIEAPDSRTFYVVVG